MATPRYLTLAAGLLKSRVDTEINDIRAEFRRVANANVSDGDMSEETQEAVAEVVDCLFG